MDEKYITDKINEEIAVTEEHISECRKKISPISPDNAIGRITRMDAIINKSVTESSLKQAEVKLNKLRYALSKVGTPDFGICVECGESIPLGRILIVPESPFCVNCAE